MLWVNPGTVAPPTTEETEMSEVSIAQAKYDSLSANPDSTIAEVESAHLELHTAELEAEARKGENPGVRFPRLGEQR